MLNMHWSAAYNNIAGSPNTTGQVGEEVLKNVLDQAVSVCNLMQGMPIPPKGPDANQHIQGDLNGHGGGVEEPSPDSAAGTVVVPQDNIPPITVVAPALLKEGSTE